jgi:hypothetical protein
VLGDEIEHGPGVKKAGILPCVGTCHRFATSRPAGILQIDLRLRLHVRRLAPGMHLAQYGASQERGASQGRGKEPWIRRRSRRELFGRTPKEGARSMLDEQKHVPPQVGILRRCRRAAHQRAG